MSVFLESYRVLTRVIREGAHLKLALSELPAGEHAFTVKTCYGVMEHYGYLGLCVKSAARPPKPAVRIILQIALYHMLFSDMPRPVAVNEAVDLAKEVGKGGAAGFVNAFLRTFDGERVEVPAGEEGLSLLTGFPLFAVREIVSAYGERAERILTAKSHGVSVRFAKNMEKYLALPHEDTPFEDVRIFRNFTRDEGFFGGDYTFQSIGSVALARIAEPCGRMLDACAAPGGKSVLFAERCGEVVACELHAHRAELIKSYARRMHAMNIEVRTMDSSVFEPSFEEAFDGVFVDAPCSGLGTVSENPDLPLRKTEGGMSELCALQKKILLNCARYVKRGGRLYYATCSLLPAENDGAVETLLGTGGFSVLPADSPLPHEKTAYGLQFLPDTAFGAGFYISKFERS